MFLDRVTECLQITKTEFFWPGKNFFFLRGPKKICDIFFAFFAVFSVFLIFYGARKIGKYGGKDASMSCAPNGISLRGSVIENFREKKIVHLQV